MRIRLGHVIATTSTYREFLSGVPFLYEVTGVAGSKTVVGHVDGAWKVMRGFGEPGSQWVGAFESPTAALAALAVDLGAEADVLPADVLPHDGVARQDEDGAWRVYEVDDHGVEILREGPFDSKSEALERLKAVVPVEDGDQWVIDAAGVAYTLNG